MNGDRSPRSNDFIPHIYSSAWIAVGEDFSAAIMEFFIASELLRKANTTAMTLVPECRMSQKCAITVLYLAATSLISASQRF